MTAEEYNDKPTGSNDGRNPQMTDMMWWQQKHEDSPCEGPYESRDEAISAGRYEWDGEGFYVLQAASDPVKLSEWLGADRMIERAEEDIQDSDRYNADYDDVIFDVKPDQEADLASRIKRACDEWQDEYGLRFVPCTFSRSTVPEYIAPMVSGEALIGEKK